jgi:hypothetical protein
MASAAVANLAGKLFAINATLTPEQAKARSWMVQLRAKMDGGRLMNEKRSVELAQLNKEKGQN